MSSAPTPEDIARDATWLVQALDPPGRLVRLVRMDAAAYRRLSFLDDRMFQERPGNAQLVPWATVAPALNAGLRTDARWIFHISHVGSTLVSRLLGELSGVLAVREPRSLRDLTFCPAPLRQPFFEPVTKLMSRTFARDEFACVKTTSIVSEIAPQLVPSGERALFIYAKPENFIATLLTGERSINELRRLVDLRTRRMTERVMGLDDQNLSDAHRAAAAWACEMTSLESAADRMSDRATLWQDFDVMLADMPAALRRTADHFGFSAEEAELVALATGPLMSRYSKGPQFEYSPAVRREVIADATDRHREDIESALAMLHKAAERSSLLARALTRAEG